MLRRLVCSPKGDHPANHFVAGHKRIGGHAPLVVEHGKIAMADAAALNGDLHLFAAKRTGGMAEWLECLPGAVGGEGLDRCGHGSWGLGIDLLISSDEKSIPGKAVQPMAAPP